MIKYIIFIFVLFNFDLFSDFKKIDLINSIKNYNSKKIIYELDDYNIKAKLEIIYLNNKVNAFIKLLSNKVDKKIDEINISLKTSDNSTSSLCKVFMGSQVIKLDEKLTNFLLSSLEENANLNITFLNFEINLKNQKINKFKNSFFDKMISLIDFKFKG
ncbi:MAG: hypothetical protein K1060chlam5_00044 [Candidatus Anoxychlamydiales bacterium]|nr:hypothetical protein [Candidatus Anoxychlamydiales bacterium]